MMMINKCDKILDKISGEVDALIVVQRRVVKVEILNNTRVGIPWEKSQMIQP